MQTNWDKTGEYLVLKIAVILFGTIFLVLVFPFLCVIAFFTRDVACKC